MSTVSDRSVWSVWSVRSVSGVRNGCGRLTAAIGALALVGVLTAAMTGTARAAVIVDQSSVGGAQFGQAAIYGLVGGSPNINAVAQTFTVGLDGTLDHIDVAGLATVGPPGVPLSLTIQALSAGLPDGTVLASASVTSLPGGVGALDFSGAGLAVANGQILAMVLSAPAELFVGYYQATANVTSYAGGSLLYGIPGVFWDTTSFAPADLRFTTFVSVASTVPEPGLLASLGIGLAGFGFLRRRRPAPRA